ncbi:GDP-mannose 4,6-dehydratase [Pengzhenrongella frigida]|uniref:GDP-mannose 4,6-dehydratase n=1 Tax=Pengzhenrongella frigida TaxID=1259133 RepID=A0A4Q5MZS8_9MICO|nr:GDP-mannose 4,6-dehydratase [Cellulomonas sp. HLT2-17]RYV51372.1 GDP-mannose 4,6-dehydratase [Cellulomonas sp. HLT2-17]
MPRAFVTGITGQDGGYLAEQLLAEGVEVHGMVRAGDDDAVGALLGRSPDVVLHEGDLGDAERLGALIAQLKPDEIYNLAGISSVAYSWKEPVLTAQLSGVAAAVVLGAAWRLQEDTGHRVACLQPSSAEIFGDAERSPQDESTPVRPMSPYGAAKAYAHHMSGVYRGRGLHVATCIFFNHESPRRPLAFVTRKITAAAARIGADGSGVIRLGNLDAARDWGWAPDYVDAMVRAVRHPQPDDYVIASGRTHTVADFAEAALRRAGVGDSWREHVEVDPAFLRPADASTPVGDASKAREVLGWEPTVRFEELVGRMVDHDMELLRRSGR